MDKLVTRDELTAILPEIVALRRDLHSDPELSFDEVQTSEKIVNYLKHLLIDSQVIGKTGVVATIFNSPAFPTIALRAEMDALPIQDEKTCVYASKNPGVMHACGHDGIVAIALGVAKILQQKKTQLKCNVKFLFEPAEEIGEGARALIAGGALAAPDVDRLIIFHLANSEPLGMEIQEKVSTAEICSLDLHVSGYSSHWGEVEKGSDAIHAAGEAICAIKKCSCLEREMPSVIGIGTINGGVKNNIMADSVDMTGTLRTFLPNDRQKIISCLSRDFRKIEKTTNTQIKMTVETRTPPIFNDPELVTTGIEIGQSVFEKSRVILGRTPYLAGDNAAFYFEQIKGVRIVFFAAQEGVPNYPLHNSRFDFDESIFPYAIETLCELIAHLEVKK